MDLAVREEQRGHEAVAVDAPLGPVPEGPGEVFADAVGVLDERVDRVGRRARRDLAGGVPAHAVADGIEAQARAG